MDPDWACKPFEELTVDELYAILQLRNEVFVVEQNCVFQDADNLDQRSLHLMGWNTGQLVAYTRLLPAGLAYPEASIGRVATHPQYRGQGWGRALIQQSIHYIYQQWGKQSIRIGAQLYLSRFYEGLGFLPEGPVYLEDGIEHIHMFRP